MSLNGHSTRGSPYGVKWRASRAIFLRANPICVFCLKAGRYSPATVVDHIKPHRGDMALFWDRDNWQALCKLCHDSTKQRMEKSGVVEIDEKGNPVGLAHW